MGTKLARVALLFLVCAHSSFEVRNFFYNCYGRIKLKIHKEQYYVV